MTITRKEVAKILAAMVEYDVEQVRLDFTLNWREGCVDNIDFDLWMNEEFFDTILSVENK